MVEKSGGMERGLNGRTDVERMRVRGGERKRGSNGREGGV